MTPSSAWPSVTLFTLRPANPAREPGEFCRDDGERPRKALEKLQSFLQDKIDKYPEIAKEITDNLNIVSKELNNVNSISPDEKQLEKGKETEIHLDVNDKDLYEDANRMREENEEIEESESQERPRGFRR